MTKEERRTVRDAFKVVDRTLNRSVRHLQQSIGKLDVSEREHHVEVRDELRKVNRRLTKIENSVEETKRHAKFTSSSIEQLRRSLEAAKVIGKLDEGKPGTTYSQVINPPKGGRSR